jgi:glutathione S-transferase
MIKIYNFNRGARGVRAMWVCEEMGLSYQTETFGFPPPASYRALNPLGSVPFLEDDGGVAINESVAMMLYLADRYGPTPLLPAKTDPALARVLQMTVFGETALGAPMNTLMAAHFMAPDADKQNWSVRGTTERVEQAIAYVENILGDQLYLAGNDVTLADISVTTAFGMWKGALGKSISDKILAYRERLAARPAYQRAQQQASGKAN